jgi:hypothetical protein
MKNKKPEIRKNVGTAIVLMLCDSNMAIKLKIPRPESIGKSALHGATVITPM